MQQRADGQADAKTEVTTPGNDVRVAVHRNPRVRSLAVTLPMPTVCAVCVQRKEVLRVVETIDDVNGNVSYALVCSLVSALCWRV